MLNKIVALKNKYAALKLVVVGANFFTEGGDWRSIYVYVRHQQTNGDNVMLVVLGGLRSWAQFTMTVLFSPVVLVNCIAALSYWPVLMACLARGDIRVYLHATDYALSGFRCSSRLKYLVLKRILRRNPILCVSRKAALLYSEKYQAMNCHVVYECPGEIEQAQLDKSSANILMVGSVSKRKGAELFSRVADLAAQLSLPWKFHWVGAIAELEPLYRSENVVWHGWQWSPNHFIESCDAFFLSSVDDPFPLAFAEAMQSGKRCIAYRSTGAAEAIEGLAGCSVYGKYEPEDALMAIKAAFSASDECRPAIVAKGTELSGLANFMARMEQALYQNNPAGKS